MHIANSTLVFISLYDAAVSNQRTRNLKILPNPNMLSPQKEIGAKWK